jgi:hypothetical protein
MEQCAKECEADDFCTGATFIEDVNNDWGLCEMMAWASPPAPVGTPCYYEYGAYFVYAASWWCVYSPAGISL